MKKYLVLLLIVFTLSLVFGNASIAQDKKTPKKTKKKTLAEDTTPVVPFDINAEKLPSTYKGTDIARLYALLLKKAPLEKEEFETTADYEKKIAEAVTGDIYAFKLDSNVFGIRGLRIHPYDADAQILKIDLESEYLSKYTFEDYRASFIIRTLDKGSDSYIGSNAFGATRLVTNYRGTQYGIALVNQQEFGKSRYDDDRYKIETILTSVREINMKIKIPIDKAKSLKNNIGVLLLCKPALYKSNAKMKLHAGNDLIFEDTSYSGATIDSPTSFSYDRKFINVEVLSIWVYEINTGSILLKKQLKNKEDQGIHFVE